MFFWYGIIMLKFVLLWCKSISKKHVVKVTTEQSFGLIGKSKNWNFAETYIWLDSWMIIFFSVILLWVWMDRFQRDMFVFKDSWMIIFFFCYFTLGMNDRFQRDMFGFKGITCMLLEIHGISGLFLMVLFKEKCFSG